MSDSDKQQEFWIDPDYTMIYKSKEDAHNNCCKYVRVIEYSTYEKLEAELESMTQKYCELKAREINNSPLRGYDGMVDRYRKELALKDEQLKVAEYELFTVSEVLKSTSRDGQAGIFLRLIERLDKALIEIKEYRGKK